jgi:hypothetical protein
LTGQCRLICIVGQKTMAFQRRDVFYIPHEFRDLPEAKLARAAEEEFAAAIERERKIATASGAQVHMISENLQRLQKKLKEAQDIFDAAAGLPIPARLTPKVKEEVSKYFPAEQRDEVVALLEKRCGRTIPFHRDSDSLELEPYRLRVLIESKGDITELKKWVEAANVLGSEILSL